MGSLRVGGDESNMGLIHGPGSGCDSVSRQWIYLIWGSGVLRLSQLS